MGIIVIVQDIISKTQRANTLFWVFVDFPLQCTVSLSFFYHYRYTSRIEALEASLEKANHEKRLMELDYEKRLRDSHEITARANEDTASALAAQRTATIALQNYEREYKDKLALMKSDFTDLRLSKESYYELRNMDPQTLSIRQYIQLRIMDTIEPLNQTIDAVRKQNEEYDKKLSQLKTDKENELQEYIQRAMLAVAHEKTALEQVKLHEITIDTLQTKLHASLTMIEILQGKGTMYDTVDKRKHELEDKTLQDAHTIAIQAGSLENAKNEIHNLESKVSLLQTRIESLIAEKSTLVSALEDNRSHARSLEDTQERLQSQLLDMERQRDSARESAARLVADARTPVEERVDQEVRRMREERQLELETLRINMKEMYEREINTLRTSRTETLAELVRTRERYETLQTNYDQLVKESMEKVNRTETELTDQRAELRMKVYALEQEQISHAEDVDQLQRLRNENDLLRDKLSVAQSECAKLEGMIEKTKANLQLYDQMESTVDAAVMMAASRQDEDNNAADGKDGFQVLQTLGINSMNPSIARRIEQAIALGKELLTVKKENESFVIRNNTLNELYENSQKQVQDLQNQLGAIEGPQEYFITLLRTRSTEIQNLQKENKELRQTINDWRNQITVLTNEKQEKDTEIELLRNRTNNAETKSLTLRNLLEETQTLLCQQQYQIQDQTGTMNGSPRKTGDIDNNSTGSSPLSVTDQQIRSPLTKLSVNPQQLPPGGVPVSPGPVTRYMYNKQYQSSSTDTFQLHVRPPGNTMDNKVRKQRTEPFSSEIPFTNGIEFQFTEEVESKKETISYVTGGSPPPVVTNTTQKLSRTSKVTNRLPGADEPSHSNRSHFHPLTTGDHSFHVSSNPRGSSPPSDVTVRPLMLMAGATVLPKWYKRNTPIATTNT